MALLCAVLLPLTANSAIAAPTPVPGPGSAPSVRPAVSPVPSPSLAPAAATVAPTAALTAAPATASTRVPAATMTAGPARETVDADATDREPTSDQEEPDWRAFVPTDVGDHLATMDRAARESGCGVPWQLLAAIARVESDFGRNMATSSAGAVGYGQFLPSSWQAFGREGNAYDYRDALPAIARYLCQSGLASDPRVALFAYNHADWYVDLVLDLAVRYDHLAPGAPTPQVLYVGPAHAPTHVMRYAAARDLARQSERRSTAEAKWLGVPWHGRAPGSSIDAAALDTSALEMVFATFHIAADPSGSESLDTRAWHAGLLAWPSAAPSGWSLAELHRRVDADMPVVLNVSGFGHDQPIVVIGATPRGLIVSDPSFASTLGYGLEINDVDLLAAWQAASTPLQALAFSRAPRVGEVHLAQAQLPSVLPRVIVTPPPPAHSELPPQLAPVSYATLQVRVAPAEDDWSEVILAASGVLVAAAVALRQRRGERSAAFGHPDTPRPRSDQ